MELFILSFGKWKRQQHKPYEALLSSANPFHCVFTFIFVKNSPSSFNSSSFHRINSCLHLFAFFVCLLFFQINLITAQHRPFNASMVTDSPSSISTYSTLPPTTSTPKPSNNSEELGAYISKILNNFFKSGYDKRVRPSYGGIPVQIGVTMFVISISSVSEVQMDFTSDFYFRQHWKDSRLSFTPMGKINQIFVGAEVSERIWLPDTFFANEKSAYFHIATTKNTFLRITSNGDVTRSIRLTVTASCPMDLQYFPMDRQMCAIEIESYGYSMSDIEYKWLPVSNAVSLSNQLSLPQFRVLGHRQKEKVIELTTGNYSRLICEIQFARSLGFYLIQIYIPASLIVVISWVSFWLHRNATPARVSLGVTTVLTMTTLMSSTNAQLPKISYIKSIDVFLGTCFVMVFGSLLEYAIVGYLGKRISMRKSVSEPIVQQLAPPLHPSSHSLSQNHIVHSTSINKVMSYEGQRSHADKQNLSPFKSNANSLATFNRASPAHTSQLTASSLPFQPQNQMQMSPGKSRPLFNSQQKKSHTSANPISSYLHSSFAHTFHSASQQQQPLFNIAANPSLPPSSFPFSSSSGSYHHHHHHQQQQQYPSSSFSSFCPSNLHPNLYPPNYHLSNPTASYATQPFQSQEAFRQSPYSRPASPLPYNRLSSWQPEPLHPFRCPPSLHTSANDLSANPSLQSRCFREFDREFDSYLQAHKRSYSHQMPLSHRSTQSLDLDQTMQVSSNGVRTRVGSQLSAYDPCIEESRYSRFAPPSKLHGHASDERSAGNRPASLSNHVATQTSARAANDKQPSDPSFCSSPSKTTHSQETNRLKPKSNSTSIDRADSNNNNTNQNQTNSSVTSTTTSNGLQATATLTTTMSSSGAVSTHVHSNSSSSAHHGRRMTGRIPNRSARSTVIGRRPTARGWRVTSRFLGVLRLKTCRNPNKVCGLSPSDIDKYSRVIFPVSFFCFNLMYWIIYLHISDDTKSDLVPLGS